MNQTKCPAKIFWETTISSERNPTLSTEYNPIETVPTEPAHSRVCLAQYPPQNMAYAREGLTRDAQAQNTAQASRKTVVRGKSFYLEMVIGNLCRPQEAIIPASRHSEEPCLDWKPGVDD